jgi:hypothetical protein
LKFEVASLSVQNAEQSSRLHARVVAICALRILPFAPNAACLSPAPDKTTTIDLSQQFR